MGKEKGNQRKSSASSGRRKKEAKVEKQMVSSRIENTPTPPTTEKKERMSGSLHAYRSNLKKLGVDLAKEAIKMTESNLLSAKLGLWEAMKVVEEKLKEMKQ